MEKESEGVVYKIDKELGKGSYGSVYRLTCSQSPHGPQSKYALKVIEGHGVGAREQEAAHKELRIMRGLYHPAIVTLVDSFQVHHRLLLVLELCEGGDLRNYLDTLKKRRLTARMGAEESLVVQWTLQLTEGLQYLHHKKILHRDLKPQNIFLKDKFSIKIGDLGIARQLVFTKEMAATHIGTPLYISPEIYQGNSYSYKTDIWSLGCCVYEMMTLQYAFHASSRYELVGRVVNKQVLPLPEAYSSSLRNLVMSMLCKDPDGRPHARQLLTALQQLDTEPTQSQKSNTDPDQSERPKDAKSLQDWRFRTAKALTQFLNEKQALQCAQINAALAQRLTIDSIKDLTSSSEDAASSHGAASRARRRRDIPSQLSTSEEETVDGEDVTGSLSLTESGNSDLTLSSEHTQWNSGAESTLYDSQSWTESKQDRSKNRNRLLSGKSEHLWQRRQYQNREMDDDDTLGSESESDDCPSPTIVPSTRLKVGKSSMVVRARPLPQPNLYKERENRVDSSLEYQTTSESSAHCNTSSSPVLEDSLSEQKAAASSKPSVNSSQTQSSDSQQQIISSKDVDMAYANEVLQWTRGRLLPTSSENIVTNVSLDRSRHTLSGETESSSTGKNSSPMKENAARKKGRVRDLIAQKEKRVKERMRSSEAQETNGMKEESGVRDMHVREMDKDTEKGTGTRGRDREQEMGAAPDLDSTAQVHVSQDKGKKKKRNFLKERKSKDGQGKGADGPKAADKVASEDIQEDKAAMDLQKEHGVKLFTRAQRVTFMSLQEDDMDLSIGGESEWPEGQIIREMGEDRLQAAVSTVLLLPHNPSLVELHLREILGRENYKKYVTAIFKMAENRLSAMK